jgi:cytochrome c
MTSYRLMCLIAINVAAECVAAGSPVRAQFSPAPPTAPTPQALFVGQCGTCHTLSAQEPTRQGPPLGGVFGRKAGAVAGFKYSPGFANADFAWDSARLDAWLTRPQDVVPGAVMVYRQANPTIRHSIIDWLKEQH